VSLALLLSALMLAAAPEVSLNIGPEGPEVGLVMTATLKITGAEGADCSLIGLPSIDGARLGTPLGPSHQSYVEIVNGRTRRSVSTIWQFELIPEREGLLQVPAFGLMCRGARIETEPQAFMVGPSALIKDIVRVSVEPSTFEAWVGQVINMRVELSILETAHDSLAPNGLRVVLPWLEDVPGLHMLEPPVPSCSDGVMTVLPSERQIPTCIERVRDGGRYRIVFSQTIPLLATEAGSTSLPESRFSARVVVDRGSNSRNEFGFFGSRRTTASRTVVSDAYALGPRLLIREPPSLGRPASYTNAVGSYRFTGEARPRTLRVGESCTLTLALASDHGPAPQLARVEWPGFEARLGDFRVFGKEDNSSSRGRVLQLEVSPVSELVDTIPALEFSWFDPALGRYETGTVGPFALDVSPGGRDGLAQLATPEEILNDLETIRERLPPAVGALPPVWIGPAAALALLLLLELRQRSRRWRAAHPAAVARRGARAGLSRGLAQADDVRSVAAVFARFLSARLDGPPAGMTAEEAGARLQDPELAAQLSVVVSGWEAAYLGGATLALNDARDQARALARALESHS